MEPVDPDPYASISPQAPVEAFAAEHGRALNHPQESLFAAS